MDIEKLFNYGLPTAILFVFAFYLWRVLLWAKTNVVEPIVVVHVSLMKRLTEDIPKQTESIRQLGIQAKSSINENSRQVESNTKAIMELTAWWRKVGSDPTKICKAGDGPGAK